MENGQTFVQKTRTANKLKKKVCACVKAKVCVRVRVRVLKLKVCESAYVHLSWCARICQRERERVREREGVNNCQ